MNKRLENALSEIGYNFETCNLAYGKMIMKINYENDKSFDTYTREAKDVYTIYLTNISKPCAEITFDIYRQIGYILIETGKISIEPAKEFITDLKPFNSMVLYNSMTADGYAFAQMHYQGEINKYIHMLDIDKINAKNKSNDQLIILIESENEMIHYRRKFLEHLKRKFQAAKYNEKLPYDIEPKTTPSKRKKIKAIIDGFADIYETSTNKPKLIPMIDYGLKGLKVNFNEKDSFDEKIKKLIDAIKFPETYKFDFTDCKYRIIMEEPDDWEQNYDKYYSRGEKGIYFRISGVKIKDENDNDIIVAPTFSSIAVFKKMPKNEKKEMNEIVTITKQFIDQFIIPQYEIYKKEFHVDKRNSQREIIEYAIQNFSHTHSIPNVGDVKEILGNNITTFESNVKDIIKSKKLLSYKEKMNIAEKENPKYIWENDMQYKERLNGMIMNGEIS